MLEIRKQLVRRFARTRPAPFTVRGVAHALGLPFDDVAQYLAELEAQGKIRERTDLDPFTVWGPFYQS